MTTWRICQECDKKVLMAFNNFDGNIEKLIKGNELCSCKENRHIIERVKQRIEDKRTSGRKNKNEFKKTTR